MARNRNAINNRDKKYEDRLEMFVHNGHDTGVMNWYNAGLRVISKTSGLPIVGDSKTIHVSKSRPFWNKYLFYQRFSDYANTAKTTFTVTIYQAPTGPPSFLAENLEAKSFI
jgi:hypothetical protein